MSRQISRAESWEAVHYAFKQINFAAFDYNSVKQSLIEYLKLYHPEFNNFIESDEAIMIIESFAYIAEQYAYRLDVTAHENLLPLAQRKDSILKLAKLISYSASRNLPARGLVKLTSIRTTERIIDSYGNNLSNTTIVWNDITNPNWKEQFILVMNHILTNDFGTVYPTDRVQVYDQIFELYSLNNIPLANSVIKYSISVSGTSVPMELTSAALDANGPYERRPERDASFTILYSSDGLGDSSNNTGFFMFTKQGTLLSSKQTFDGITPNQTLDLLVNNINDIDVWVNNIDPATGSITNDFSVPRTRSGEWEQVSTAYAQNIIYNTNSNRNKFEVETLDNDNIRIIFGDGEFSNIPAGTFEIWYRTSLNSDLSIPQISIYELNSSLAYKDLNNTNQSLTFTFSSVQTIQNGSPSEDIEHIRKVAPSVYYTQDRMVNNRDYNTYLLQDQTILKLKAVNRSYAGESKYMSWHDASSTYENVKLFGDDLAIYYIDETRQVTNIPLNASAATVVINYLEPLLSDISTFMFRTLQNQSNTTRRYFTEAERHNIIFNYLGEVYFTEDTNPFDALIPVRIKYAIDPLTGLYGWVPYYTSNTADNDWVFLIDKSYDGLNYTWLLQYKATKINAESQTTKFWNFNTNKTVNYATLGTQYDKITVLKLNAGTTRTDTNTSILSKNYEFPIVGQELYDQNIQENGLPNIHVLNVLTPDVNNDGWPDDVPLSNLMDNTITVDSSILAFPHTISFEYPMLEEDFVLPTNIAANHTFTKEGNIVKSITITTMPMNTIEHIVVKDYVYMYRADAISVWGVVPLTEDVVNNWKLDVTNANYRRVRGRSGLNFLWTHVASQYHLVDPNITNIIDAFIITRGYYVAMRKWLDGNLTIKPLSPTPQDLSLSYSALMNGKMISDSLILHPGNFVILFGANAPQQLQATFAVVKSVQSTLTDNQIKTMIVNSIKDFFNINDWNFGETFNFTELAAKVHYDTQQHIDTIVLVPKYQTNYFGDLLQVNIKEEDILIPDITINDINIVTSLNHTNIKQIA